MFAISMITQAGNGQHTLLWSDHWLHGQYLMDLAPNLVAAVPIRVVKHRTIAQAWKKNTWMHDIQGNRSAAVLRELLLLVDALEGVELQPHEEDRHIWRHANSGQFSTKSACTAYFTGAVKFEPWKRLWRAWAPLKCKMILWLAIRNRCWTADRLAC